MEDGSKTVTVHIAASWLNERAADGPAGLKILGSDVRIDLVVTDVGLPGGMNGRQVADAARSSIHGIIKA